MFRHVKFATVPVADQDRAVAFFRDTLGLKLEVDADYDGSGWRWIEFSIPGAQTRVLFDKAEPGHEAHEEPALVLVVEDVEALTADLKARGVTFTLEPVAAPWDSRELYALFADSEGNTVMIGGRKKAEG